MANFTAIATGAPANAATVNGPLGQLDAAIGALTSLGTVDQTSLVAAVNETRLAAGTSIGTLASLSTTAQSSLVAAINELFAKSLTGGASVQNAQLIAWTEAGAYEATAVTMDTTDDMVPATATVKWPDGSAGAFTATAINATWSAVDAYTVTHTASGKTVTQATVSRNDDGIVTTKPALTVS